MSSRRKGEEKEEPTEKTALLSDTDSKGEKDSLASGPVINIYDPSNIGYLMQYYAVGLIYGGLPATVYGFFVGYLNVRHHPLQPRAPAHWAQHPAAHRPPLACAGAGVRVRDLGRDHDDAVVLQVLLRHDQRLLPHRRLQVSHLAPTARHPLWHHPCLPHPDGQAQAVHVHRLDLLLGDARAVVLHGSA